MKSSEFIKKLDECSSVGATASGSVAGVIKT